MFVIGKSRLRHQPAMSFLHKNNVVYSFIHLQFSPIRLEENLDHIEFFRGHRQFSALILPVLQRSDVVSRQLEACCIWLKG